MCQKTKVSVFEKRRNSVSVGAQHYDLRYKTVPRTSGTSTEVHTTMLLFLAKVRAMAKTMAKAMALPMPKTMAKPMAKHGRGLWCCIAMRWKVVC